MVAEGLDIFEVEIPEALIGKRVAECDLRNLTGCTLIAIHQDGQVQIVSDPQQPLPGEGKIILIGDSESEKRFLKRYKHNGKR
jgi:K+/H+ antiporter YhaU regulatory subunit KhtT